MRVCDTVAKSPIAAHCRPRRPHAWRCSSACRPRLAWPQIQKTSEALVNHGFVGLRTFECLLHYYELHTERPITDLDNVPDEREGGKGGQNKRRRDGGPVPAVAAEEGGRSFLRVCLRRWLLRSRAWRPVGTLAISSLRGRRCSADVEFSAGKGFRLNMT